MMEITVRMAKIVMRRKKSRKNLMKTCLSITTRMITLWIWRETTGNLKMSLMIATELSQI
jgi:hypothetical protein